MIDWNDFCDKTSDDFNKEDETVFQLKMGGFDSSGVQQNDVEAKGWVQYTDVSSDKSGFICEKEGTIGY